MHFPFTFVIIAPKNEKGKSFLKKLISYRSELSNLGYGLPGEYARYYSYHSIPLSNRRAHRPFGRFTTECRVCSKSRWSARI